MAKNMTRKGLALGAGGLLVASMLSAAPASANTLTILPESGTSNVMISGEMFKMKVIGQTLSTNDNLQWEISNPDEESLTIATTGSGGTQELNGSAGSSSSAEEIVVLPVGTEAGAGTNELHIETGATAETTLQVRAYLESGDAPGYNSSFDTPASGLFSVTFIKAEDVATTITITEPRSGDDTVTASMTTNVNNEQLTNTEFHLHFFKGDDTDLSNTIGDVNQTVAAWDEDNGFVATTATLSPVLAKDSAVKVQALYKDGGSPATTDTIGDEAFALVTEVVAEEIKPSTVPSSDANASDQFVSGDASFQVQVNVDDDDTTAADGDPVAGETVSVSLSTDRALDADNDITLSIGGTNYDDNSDLPGASGVDEIELTTDADGNVLIDVVTEGFSNGDDIVMEFTVANLSPVTHTVTATDASYTLSVVNANMDIATTSGSASVLVEVYDQFGGTLPAGYDVRSNLTDSTQADTNATTASNSNAAIVNGSATLGIVSDGEGVGVNTYDLSVQERLPGGGYAGAVDTFTGFDVHVVTAAQLAANAIDVTIKTGDDADTEDILERSGGSLELADFGSFVEREVLGTEPVLSETVDISGTVQVEATPTSAAGNVPGAVVTATGEGLQFVAEADEDDSGDNEKTYSVGSAVVFADSSGAYTLGVSSNMAGEQEIVLTSGNATQVIHVDFGAAATNTGENLTIDAPSAVEPGSTLVFTASLTDKYGNPVVQAASGVTFNYDGPGFIVAEGTAFDADGEEVVTIFLGNNDDGKTGTLTVTVDSGNNATDDDLVVQKTVNIGDVPLAAGEFNAWTKLSDDLTNVKFYAKNPSDQGKIQFFFNGEEIAWHRGTSATSYEGGEPRYNVEQDAYYLVRDRDLVVGSQNVFEIYQDGTRIWRAVKTID